MLCMFLFYYIPENFTNKLCSLLKKLTNYRKFAEFSETLSKPMNTITCYYYYYVILLSITITTVCYYYTITIKSS